MSKPTANDWAKHLPFIATWEGGRVNDPIDRGGDTVRGITIGTFNGLYTKLTGKPATRANFIGLLKNETDYNKFIKAYWDIATNGGAIKNSTVAAQMFEWFWGSGYDGLKSWQKMLNTLYGKKLVVDGIVGINTVNATNSIEPKRILADAINWRIAFLENIVKNDPSQARFIKGWKNRVNAFTKFYPVIAGTGIVLLLIVAAYLTTK